MNALHCLPVEAEGEQTHSMELFVFFVGIDSIRLALSRHGEEQNGLLTGSGFAPGLVLAGPLQSHVHAGVLPGAVGVVVVTLQPLQEVAFVRRPSLGRKDRAGFSSASSVRNSIEEGGEIKSTGYRDKDQLSHSETFTLQTEEM